MLVAGSSAPQEPGGTAPEDFLVRSPGLERAARNAADLPSQIRVGKDRGVEVGAVGAPGPRSQASVGVQALGASEDVPQHDVQVCASLGAASLSARLDGVPAPLARANEDCMVGGCGGRVGLVRSVDVSADGPVEDVESVELVHSAADLGKSFLKGVGGVAVVGEDGVEDALEEGGASVRCADQTDGRNGHWLGGVDANLRVLEEIPEVVWVLSMVCKTHNLSLATLGAIILALSPLVELTLTLLDHLGIHGLLELFEDLRVFVCVSVRVPCMGIVDYLTSSPEYGTAIVIVPCAVDPARPVALLLLLLLQEYHHCRALLRFPPSLSHTSGQLACSLCL